MFITRLSLPRRAFLRGVGISLGLPLLDAMVPALTAVAKTAAVPQRRLGFVYVPNGVIMEQWTPSASGAGFELTPIARHRLSAASGFWIISSGRPRLHRRPMCRRSRTRKMTASRTRSGNEWKSTDRIPRAPVVTR